MIQVINELKRLFTKYNISTNGLTVILNFSDAESAFKFEIAMIREMSLWQFTPPPIGRGLDDLKIYGIKVDLKSPAHEPLA